MLLALYVNKTVFITLLQFNFKEKSQVTFISKHISALGSFSFSKKMADGSEPNMCLKKICCIYFKLYLFHHYDVLYFVLEL